MRVLIAVLLAVLAAGPALACEGFEHDMDALEHSMRQSDPNAPAKPATATFAREFESAQELQRWTETSTLGGGRTEAAKFEGRDFIFAYRSYTSGVKSSDAAVYMQEGDEWKLVKAYPVLMNDWIVAERGEEGIVFRPESGEKSLMVLGKADLARF